MWSSERRGNLGLQREYRAQGLYTQDKEFRGYTKNRELGGYTKETRISRLQENIIFGAPYALDLWTKMTPLL
jgi:hypothetical protein